MWLRKLTVSVGSSLWFVPVMCVVAGGAISFGTLALDRAFDYEAIPEGLVGHPTSATAILNTIAASMVSLAALVLTITMVVVQLAMGQFSPRIVQRVLRDKPSQLAIGLFVATFAHAVLAMREVRFDDGGSVPGLAIIVAYVLVLVSIVVLVLYVHHIGQTHTIMALVRAGFPVLMLTQDDDTRAGIEDLAAEFAGRGDHVLLAGTEAPGATRLPSVKAHPVLEPLLAIQSFYRAAEALARARGLDPDRPPHLNKVTETV